MHTFAQRMGTILCWAFLLFTPLAVAGQEAIHSFESVLEIRDDGSVLVTETIGYDFTDNADNRHGIFREIPLMYEFEDTQYRLDISDIDVTSPTDAPSETVVDGHGQELEIRIGDPDETINGAHQYVITYTAENALRAHSDSYELYWNATGTEWEVPINSAEVILMLPEEASREQVNMACYAGERGSANECEHIETDEAEGVLTYATFTSQDLSASEGITAAIEFPASQITGYTPTPYESNIMAMILAGAAAVAILGGFLFWFWYRYGKDPEGRGVIVRQYDPPEGLTPAETGLIVDERIHDRDITAEIVHLAQKGYIHILALPMKVLFFKKVSYVIFKLKEPDETLKKHESLIMEKMFQHGGDRSLEELMEEIPNRTHITANTLKELKEKSLDHVTLKDLERSFHKDLRKVKETLYQEFTDKGYFERNPENLTKWFTVLSIGMFISVWFIVLTSFMRDAIGWVIGAFVVLYLVLSQYVLTLVKKTPKGVRAREHGLGLKQYLSMAEKERMEFHFDPRKNPELFEKLLPYAIALKVDKQWAEQFEGLYQKEPSWYTSSGNEAFSSTAFASQLSGLSQATHASGSSSSGASGGGFSGGGSGGGGGGSW